MKKSIIIFCIALLAIILIIIPLTSNDDYKELNNITTKISSINISKSKKTNLKEAFKFKETEKEHKVYYYGIDKVELVINSNEFNMQNLFKENILNRNILEEYLELESTSNHINYETLYDGEEKVYTSDNYKILMCNTSDGNKDIYIGLKDMKIKDEYCK